MSIRDLGILLHALYLTFTKRRVTIRRTLFTLFAVSLYLCFRIVVRVGHVVDDLFFRGYQQQTVQAPLYIVTFPRSGTTFLHRLMCLDEERFTFLKTSDVVSVRFCVQAGEAFVSPRSKDRRTAVQTCGLA